MKRTTIIMVAALMISMFTTVNAQNHTATSGTKNLETISTITNLVDSIRGENEGLQIENLNGYKVFARVQPTDNVTYYMFYFRKFDDVLSNYNVSIMVHVSGKMIVSVEVPESEERVTRSNGRPERHVTLNEDGTMYNKDLSGNRHPQSIETIDWLELTGITFKSVVL